MVQYLGRNEFVLIKSHSLSTKKDNILYGLKGFFLSKMPTSGFHEKKTGKKKLIIKHLKKIYYLNRGKGSNLLGDYYPLAKSITASKPGLDLCPRQTISPSTPFFER